MNSTVAAAIGRPSVLRPEAVFAAGLVLSAVTVTYMTSAFAALFTSSETIVLTSAPVPAPVVETPVPPVEPAEPPPFLAFGEPVPGYDVVSPFGLRRLPWERHGRLHEGVDIAAPGGSPVLAAADGVVVRAGSGSGYGRHVEIRHAGGLVTRYAHLARIDRSIRPGARVLAGQPLGKVGSSGVSTGPHVHFEIRRNDRPLNPSAFLGRSFAALEDLPLKSAARYSRKVRVAYVSFIPKEKRALMEDKGETGEAKVKRSEDGRPRATFELAAKPAAVAAATPAPASEAHPSDTAPAEAHAAEATGVDASAVLPVEPIAKAGAD